MSEQKDCMEKRCSSIATKEIDGHHVCDYHYSKLNGYNMNDLNNNSEKENHVFNLFDDGYLVHKEYIAMGVCKSTVDGTLMIVGVNSNPIVTIKKDGSVSYKENEIYDHVNRIYESFMNRR